MAQPWRLSLIGIASWAGCHAIAGLDDLVVGDETPGEGGAAVQASSNATGTGGVVGVGGSGGLAGVGGLTSSVDVSVSSTGGGNCCEALATNGCPWDTDCQTCVCSCDPSCCQGPWDASCADIAAGVCPMECGCPSGMPQPCVARGTP